MIRSAAVTYFRGLALLLAFASLDVHASDRVVLIFDASRSMTRGGKSGYSRFAEAQKAAKGLAPHFSSGTRQVGLVAFGHTGFNCDVTPVLAPSNGTGSRIPGLIQNMVPQGYTPLAESLELAAGQLARGGKPGEGDRIILLTDGVETCNGDPVGTARSLRAKYPGLAIHVVGFSVGPVTSAHLREVAVAGGGSLQITHGSGSLESALGAALKGDYIAPASPMPELKGAQPIMDPESIPRELDFGDAPDAVPPSLSQMEAELSDEPMPLKAGPMPKEEEDEKKAPPADIPGRLPPEPEIKPIPLM